MVQQALIQSRGQHRENRSSLGCKATTSKDEQQEESVCGVGQGEKGLQASMEIVPLGQCLQETAHERMLITD